MAELPDSGTRREFATGAVRDAEEGKGRYDLISVYALRRLARHYENGAKKYNDRNWEKGIPFHSFIDSAKRHLDKYIMGEKKEDHLAAVAWNVFCLMHFEELGREDLNDLPKYANEVPKTSDI